MKESEILNELLQRQLKNVPYDRKLRYNDLKRLSKYIDVTIFDENKCSLWNGYITNINNASKGIYINFYFKGKKAALHRLLYVNFVSPLTDDEYLKFSCDNKGKCCNVTHLRKFKYIKNTQNEIAEENKKEDIKNEDVKPIIKKKGVTSTNTSFTVSFD